MSVKLNFIGHSCFFIESEKAGVLVDPFISQNPSAVFNIPQEEIKDILLTHAHFDHMGDAVPLSKKSNAPITAILELANYCSSLGAFVFPVNFGGKVELNGGYARFFPAFHSSSTLDGQYMGMPASILMDIGGKKIYHAGDTCLNTEMRTLKELYQIDVALLPIGSNFTMDIEHAVIAAQWLGAQTVIPMHYNTFPLIKTDANLFKEKIEAIGKNCVILEPGESFEL